MEKWRHPVEDKEFLVEQEQQIRQENKINQELSQLSGEKLFKPFTKRQDKPTKEPEPAEERDFGMDDFHRLNLFYNSDFKPRAETPPPTQPTSPPPTPTPAATPP